MKIGIIGLGYVGLTLAIAAASRGAEIFGTEINLRIKSALSKNRATFFEPQLNELIAAHNHKNFHCVNSFDANGRFDAFIITVGTPLLANSTKPNFAAISTAIESLRNAYDGSQLVVIRSTVSVGTTRRIVLPLLAKLSGKPAEELFVSMCPERTIEGKALHELKTLPQIISGNNPAALQMARRVFEKISPRVIEAQSLEAAELAKLYCNTYRDINFSVGNAFCLAAQKFGVDGAKVINLANEGYPRAKIALPGFVAGPCLEKDAYILTDNMPPCASKNFILAARNISESLEDFVVDWCKRHVHTSATLILSGIAFKGRPATSDLRGSASVNIARKLSAAGYSLRLHDFVATIDDLQALNLGEVFDDLSAACEGATALLVLNNHERYENFQLPATKNFTVLDAWSVCKKICAGESVKVFTLGNFLLEEGGTCAE